MTLDLASKLSRRAAMQNILLGTTSMLVMSRPKDAAAGSVSLDGPVVQTSEGHVRGAVLAGINIFKGIPYGASTAGQNRFLPPKRARRWSGIRNALEYGPIPTTYAGDSKRYTQVLRGIYPDRLIGATPDRGMSEDCLFLNVWSPGLGADTKRPVMIWLLPWAGYSRSAEGRNLARRGDVVVVSLGHRSSLGHLYLGDLAGPKYAQSGNVGLLDIVAALSWIQENISTFGGDPENVTIFGESEASALITVLMAMPAAKGLFHKAIIESTVRLRAAPREFATGVTAEVFRRLGLHPKEFEKLHEIPPGQLLSAFQGLVLHAVVDGVSLPRHPFDPDAPPLAADVPVIIGTNKDEGTYHFLRLPLPEKFREEDLAHNLVTHFPHLGIIDDTQATRLVTAYRELHPTQSPQEAFVGVGTGLVRDNVVVVAERKLAQLRAPLYMYLFAWESPAFSGLYGSSHTFEIPFVFDNVDAVPQLIGPDHDPQRYQLAANICQAWATFAHAGSPSHPGLPAWRPYSMHDRTTMVLNYECRAISDPQHDERALFERFRSRLSNVFPENCSRPKSWNCERAR